MRDSVKVGWRIKCEHFLVSFVTVAEKEPRLSEIRLEKKNENSIFLHSGCSLAIWLPG